MNGERFPPRRDKGVLEGTIVTRIPSCDEDEVVFICEESYFRDSKHSKEFLLKQIETAHRRFEAQRKKENRLDRHFEKQQLNEHSSNNNGSKLQRKVNAGKNAKGNV
jgi:hypothetical protein